MSRSHSIGQSTNRTFSPSISNLPNTTKKSSPQSHKIFKSSIKTQEALHQAIFSLKEDIQEKQAIIECSGNLPNLQMPSFHLNRLFKNLIHDFLAFSSKFSEVKIIGNIIESEVVFIIKSSCFYPQITTCENIIDRYNGRVWYEYDESNETSFHLAFPQEMAA